MVIKDRVWLAISFLNAMDCGFDLAHKHTDAVLCDILLAAATFFLSLRGLS